MNFVKRAKAIARRIIKGAPTKTKYKQFSVAEKKEFWRRNPVSGNMSITLPFLTESFLMYSQNDDTVVKELYWTGFKGWEPTSLKIWFNILDRKSDTVVLDIGAYSGIYSLIAAHSSPSSHIYAFDIQKKCKDRIEKNATLNNFKNITCILAACSDSNGEIPFFFYEEEGILSSVASVVPKAMNTKTAIVREICLDNFLKDKSDICHIGAIKIDVEDAETKALAGLRESIERSKPDILVEINNVDNISAALKTLPEGYKIYRINEVENNISEVTGAENVLSEGRNFLATTRTGRDLDGLLI